MLSARFSDMLLFLFPFGSTGSLLIQKRRSLAFLLGVVVACALRIWECVGRLLLIEEICQVNILPVDVSRNRSAMDEIGSLGAILGAKFAQNTLHMLLYGPLRDMQFLRNMAVTISLADELEYFAFPRCQLC